jgi:thiamine-phosphate pyrophosphorylase
MLAGTGAEHHKDRLRSVLRGLYPILDCDTLRAHGCSVIDAAEALLDGGARILQYRHKEFWSREIVAEAERVGELCRTRGALFIVNDRADYAKMLGAGVHVGQDDLPPRAARELLGDDAVIGYSTHNAAQLEAAAGEPVDYVALGPVFGTASKRNPDPVVGVGNIESWRSLVPQPMVAIGGITRANARDVWAAGAEMVAVIGDLYGGVCDAGSIRERMCEWLRLTRK